MINVDCSSVVVQLSRQTYTPMDTNQKVHPSLPPNSYFSPKWLKMLPFAAVHSFNPRQDPVEKQTPTIPRILQHAFSRFILATDAAPIVRRRNIKRATYRKLISRGYFMRQRHEVPG